jgi:CheY-like chemotaxis protein
MTKTFILADDDTDDIELFCNALKEIDKSIHCKQALNGLQLLNTLLDSSNSKPDIIFLDINMPVMNGWKCLQALKDDEKTKDIPVIIYTTSSELMEAKKSTPVRCTLFL